MGSEYELKYRADEEALSSVRTTFPARWQKIPMETTYYDTPSRSLSARRYMLRRRLENGVSVCTLKTAGNGNLRGEWEVNSDSVTDAIPELCKLGCPADLETLCAEAEARQSMGCPPCQPMHSGIQRPSPQGMPALTNVSGDHLYHSLS